MLSDTARNYIIVQAPARAHAYARARLLVGSSEAARFLNRAAVDRRPAARHCSFNATKALCNIHLKEYPK